MANLKKRSPTSAAVQKNAIDQATLLLKQLPEKPKEVWSLREAIEKLKDTITAALHKGYSYEEVSAMLTEKGVKISASSLKSYLAATKKDKSAGRTRKTRTPRAKKAVAEPVAVAALPVATASAGASTKEPKKRGPRAGSVQPKATAAKAKPTSKKTETKTAAKPTSTRTRKKNPA